MPRPDRLPSADRGVRILRLVAAMSVIVALVAVVAILKGDQAGKGNMLIIVAIALGACALVGMAVLALPHAYPRKEKNDPRP